MNILYEQKCSLLHVALPELMNIRGKKAIWEIKYMFLEISMFV